MKEEEKEEPGNEEKAAESKPQESEQINVKEQVFHFDFREVEVNLLLKALGELPTKETFNLVSRIFLLVGQQRLPVQQ
jgi:hypothetical protein